MSPPSDSPTSDHRPPTSSLLTVAVLSLVVGAAAGLVGAMFRLGLDQANHFRNALADWAHGYSIIGLPIVIAVCAAATALAAWLVRRFAPAPPAAASRTSKPSSTKNSRPPSG